MADPLIGVPVKIPTVKIAVPKVTTPRAPRVGGARLALGGPDPVPKTVAGAVKTAKTVLPKTQKPVKVKTPTTGSTTTGAPAAGTGTGASSSGLPGWAQAGLDQINAQQAAHQSWLTGQVMPWYQSVATSLGNLANAGAAVGKSGGQQAAALFNLGGSIVNPVASGGPLSYLQAAGSAQDRGLAGSATSDANYAASLGVLQNAATALSPAQTLANYSAQLPTIYQQQRDTYLTKIQTALDAQARLAETDRHNRVMEALGVAKLGVSQGTLAKKPTIGQQTQSKIAVADNAARIKSAQAAQAAQAKAAAATTANNLKLKGFTGGWAAAPRGLHGTVIQASDNGRYYFKPGKGMGTKGPTPAQVASNARWWSTNVGNVVNGKIQLIPTGKLDNKNKPIMTRAPTGGLGVTGAFRQMLQTGISPQNALDMLASYDSNATGSAIDQIYNLLAPRVKNPTALIKSIFPTFIPPTLAGPPPGGQ